MIHFCKFGRRFGAPLDRYDGRVTSLNQNYVELLKTPTPDMFPRGYSSTYSISHLLCFRKQDITIYSYGCLELDTTRYGYDTDLDFFLWGESSDSVKDALFLKDYPPEEITPIALRCLGASVFTVKKNVKSSIYSKGAITISMLKNSAFSMNQLL
jgi:hypothetical protein